MSFFNLFCTYFTDILGMFKGIFTRLVKKNIFNYISDISGTFVL